MDKRFEELSLFAVFDFGGDMFVKINRYGSKNNAIALSDGKATSFQLGHAVTTLQETKDADSVKFGGIVVFTKFEFGGKEYVKTPPCGTSINAVSLIRGEPSWFGVDTFVDIRKTRADVLNELIGMEVTLVLEIEGLGNWPARNVLKECDGKYSVRFDANATIEFTQYAVTRILEVDGMPTIRIGGEK